VLSRFCCCSCNATAVDSVGNCVAWQLLASVIESRIRRSGSEQQQQQQQWQWLLLRAWGGIISGSSCCWFLWLQLTCVKELQL
jgi:hypothetical protein